MYNFTSIVFKGAATFKGLFFWGGGPIWWCCSGASVR